MAMSKQELQQRQAQVDAYFQRLGIVLTPAERENIEIADFALGQFDTFGLALITYINTPRVCGKELVLLPYQICPEHLHPPIPELNYPGKEETFRCRWGEVYLYVQGEPTAQPKAHLDGVDQTHLVSWHEIVLRPGEQYTLQPSTWHWFQGGPEGAVVSEFSTQSIDEADWFRDPAIRRIPE